MMESLKGKTHGWYSSQSKASRYETAVYKSGWRKPNYPMPATTNLPTYNILCDHLLWVYYDEQIEAWMRARGM